MIRPVSMWGPNAQGVRSRPDRSVVLNPGDVERMGFDFDEFDRLISEGTSEAEQNPWDLVVDPETGELVERGALGVPPGQVTWAEHLSAQTANLAADAARQGAWVDIRDAVGSYVANVEGFDWEDMATVEEMADQITYDNLGETDRVDRQDHIYDRVWTEIIQAGEHAGYEYDLGEFVRFGPGGASVSEEHWPSTASIDRQIQAVDRVAETIDRAEVTLGNIMERLGLVENPETGQAVDRWEALGRTQEAQDLFDEGMISAEELERRRELSAEEMDRMYDEWRREDRQEREAQWEDPRPHSGDEFFHEFQATPALTGLGGFQSPRIPSGLPGFQSPGSMPSGLPGFQSPGMLSDLPGFQSPGVPSGPPGFGVPSDGLLQDLVSRMGDMPLEHKLALAAALAGAGLLTVGTGGLAGPALMAGGGLSLLGNQ